MWLGGVFCGTGPFGFELAFYYLILIKYVQRNIERCYCLFVDGNKESEASTTNR